MDGEARITRYHPDGDHNHEANEWSVEIGLNRFSVNDTQCIGPFTLDDLLRLRRVINRAIKLVQNPKKYNTKRTW